MQGMSERQYAAHVGLSRGAIQKAKTAERLVLYPDGSINAAASDARRAETTDPSKTRKPPAPKLKPVPEAAVAAVGDTLREQGLSRPRRRRRHDLPAGEDGERGAEGAGAAHPAAEAEGGVDRAGPRAGAGLPAWRARNGTHG
jgi:hypothetical protein